MNLTRNEVIHARECNHVPVLYILSDVNVEYGSGGTPMASGGRGRVFHPWVVDKHGFLEASRFVYRLKN